eukprot:Partr_v1_DN25710_c6_g1_i1_m74680 putative NA
MRLRTILLSFLRTLMLAGVFADGQIFVPIPMDEINANLVTYAFGDFHGDLASFLQNLETVNLIKSETPEAILSDFDNGKDPRITWIGGDVNLVITGDILDLGLHDIQIWEIVRFLYPIVKQKGGHLEALLGNHEINNFEANFAEVHPSLVMNEQQRAARIKRLSIRHPLGRFMRGLRAAVQIGQTVFVHGGLEPRFAKLSLKTINYALRYNLLHPNMPIPYSHKIFNDNGPFWSRYYSKPNLHESEKVKHERCERLQNSLLLLETDYLPKPVRMVVGHETQESRKIGLDCGGALIKIDIGLSKYMWLNDKSSIGGLKIVGTQAFAVYQKSEELMPLEACMRQDEHSLWRTCFGFIANF